MDRPPSSGVPALSLGISLVAMIAMSRLHWAGPLLVAVTWWIAQASRCRQLQIPRGGIGLGVALGALVTSTALSQRPSGLAWLGLLQWLSLLAGAFMVNFEIRRSRHALTWLLGGVIGIGTLDMFLWSREVLLRHWEWWIVRAEGLPLFPFRIRLFGSHGSTQAALWLVMVFLVGVYWLLPRTKGRIRLLSLGWLLWNATLLGFCDSRLAMAGAFVAVCYAGISTGSWRVAWGGLLVSNVIWLGRDLLHPSRILEGGGVEQGMFQVLLTFTLPAVVAIGRKIRIASDGRIWAAGAISFGFAVLVLPYVSQAGDAEWSTGRLRFWRVGLDGFLSNPILGTGPWSFPWMYSRTVDWSRDFLAMHPHNWVLECLSSGGLVLFGGLAWLFRTSFRTSSEDAGSAGSVISLLGLALGIAAAFDSPLASPQVLLVGVIVGGWALSRQEGRAEICVGKVWALCPLLLLLPLAYVAEGVAGKHLLVQANEVSEPRRRAIWILEKMPQPTSDPQWRREELLARTTIAPDIPDSLRLLLTRWDSLIREEPLYLPNHLHREYLRSRIGLPNRLAVLLSSFEGSGWQRAFAPTIHSRWKGRYPTDSAGYWLQRAKRWRDVGDERSIRWAAVWFRQASRPFSCAEMVWTKTLGWPSRDLQVSGAASEQLYGSGGGGKALIPSLQEDVHTSCLRNFGK